MSGPSRAMTPEERGEYAGAINAWQCVLDLIASGVPIEGLRTLAQQNLSGLKASRARAEAT